ncbi:hypothetical protein F6R98_19155 [Candidatus Methylospira mobilis]|uniref:Uncharacterized protein n=1 Tax=Candidatus Methylospira mobilis TaxID=1808979 RepID=A0A5Q0BQL1_9GAMM|nr:hypothetical protein [Candidatus Methylospira mobilis]QFY44484.1 hypothetical protein F6R98_19155 [Candidatus Methylospira mobilis]
MALYVQHGTPLDKGATSTLWLLWLVTAVYGAMHVRSAFIDYGRGDILLTAIAATAWVSAGYFWYGFSDYLGSSALDGWSYASFGEYLRHYPRGSEGGLAPLYQYASHLSGTRYVASAMLGVLIPPWSVGVDTQMTVGALLVISIFSFALALAYAAHTANQRDLNVPVALAVLLGVTGGWLPHALHANNYDNLLALPLAPALFALGSDRNFHGTGKVVLPAILVAASIYIYPELSPLIVMAYIAGAMDDFVGQTATNKRARFYTHAKIALLALLIVSPYLKDVVRYFGQQLSDAGQITGRPGEGMMPGLVNYTRIWGAMWGLGDNGFKIGVGILLLPITFTGVYGAAIKKNYSIITYLLVIGALFTVMIVSKHYDYGAYKILLLGWWAIAIVLSAGAKNIWDYVSGFDTIKLSVCRVIVAALLVTAIGIWLKQQFMWTREYKYKTAIETREARNSILKNQCAVQVSVFDVTLNAWLVYQLRDVKAIYTEFHGYMDQPHVRALMARSNTPAGGEIQCLLTDAERFTQGEEVWRGDSLKLIRGAIEQQPPGIEINAPNGREKNGGLPFFWLDRKPVTVVLTTSLTETAHIEFEGVAGPSVGGQVKNYPQIIVESTEGRLLTFDASPSARMYTVDVRLSPGKTTLKFRLEYAGDVVTNENGDPRTLLAGIKIHMVK